MQVTGGGGRFGGRRRSGVAAMAEINVTPFVDVVLVLLIIFMITAHVMESGIDITVPKTKTVEATSKDEPVIVQVNKAGEVFLGKEPVNINLLVDRIRARYPKQTVVYLRADRETTWDAPVQVMSVLGQAKFSVSVVTQPEGRARKR